MSNLCRPKSGSEIRVYTVCHSFFIFLSNYCPSRLVWLPGLDGLLLLSYNELSMSSRSSNDNCLVGPVDGWLRSQGADLTELHTESLLKDSGRLLLLDEIRSFLIRKYEPVHDKANKMICAPSKDSDQPGHLPSLIRLFAVKKHLVLGYP